GRGDGREPGAGGQAEAETLAVKLVEAPESVRLGVGDIARGTLRVVHLELEVVAALKVELGAAARSPAHLVSRMAANLRAGDRADRIRENHPPYGQAVVYDRRARKAVSKVAAADVVRRHHQLRTAPGLVDTPVLDDVREPDLGLVRVERGADERVAQLRIDHAAVERSRANDAGLFERERR